jgi:hypothetical protein
LESSTRPTARSFIGELKSRTREAAQSSIVIVAASGANEPAYEADVKGVRELLFSYHATNFLTINQRYTYDQLRLLLFNQLRPDQIPVLDGDSSRFANQFSQ